MESLLPSEMVAVFDRYVYGQENAKRMLAVALRNRWRFNQLPADSRSASGKQNVLFSGPTGSGKTELMRVLRKHFKLPVLEFDLTDFTETGYKGRDVTTIAGELLALTKTIELPKWYCESPEAVTAYDVDLLLDQVDETTEKEVKTYLGGMTAYYEVIVMVFRAFLGALAGLTAMPISSLLHLSTEMKSTSGEKIDLVEIIKLSINESKGFLNGDEGPTLLTMGLSMMSMPNDNHTNWVSSVKRRIKDFEELEEVEPEFYPEVMGKFGILPVFRLAAKAFMENPAQFIRLCKTFQFGGNGVKYVYRVARSEDVSPHAFVEKYGVVFLDEFDKIGSKPDGNGKDINGIGVQRSLLKFVEGGLYNGFDTSGILFVAAGAFSVHCLNDIMAELRGRFPLRANFKPLDKDAYKHICLLDHSDFHMEISLLRMDGVEVIYDGDTFNYIAEVAEHLNETEYLGARRLGAVISDITLPASFSPEKYRESGFDIRGEALRKNHTVPSFKE